MPPRVVGIDRTGRRQCLDLGRPDSMIDSERVDQNQRWTGTLAFIILSNAVCDHFHRRVHPRPRIDYDRRVTTTSTIRPSTVVETPTMRKAELATARFRLSLI